MPERMGKTKTHQRLFRHHLLEPRLQHRLRGLLLKSPTLADGFISGAVREPWWAGAKKAPRLTRRSHGATPWPVSNSFSHARLPGILDLGYVAEGNAVHVTVVPDSATAGEWSLVSLPGIGMLLSVPRKVRQLIEDLEKAGFENRGGKGSHRNFLHPASGAKITLSGKSGEDAKHYQEQDLKRAIERSKP